MMIVLPQRTKEILLTKGKVALVDEIDYERINKLSWYAVKRGRSWYASRRVCVDGRLCTEHMHRVIAQTPIGMETDHINKDGLDNRRCNLRICTHAENQHNQNPQSRNRYSHFKGITWDKLNNKWTAKIKADGRVIYLGRYQSERDAAEAYDKAAKQYHTSFACTNF